MKVQSLVLGLALAVAGSAFATTVTQERTVTRSTPHGTMTRHVVRTRDEPVVRHATRHVLVVNNHAHRHHVKKVVIIHPAHHGRHLVNRTVVVHRHV